MNSIGKTLAENMCIQCGICAAVCPKKAITLKKKAYDFLPQINADCVDCGVCLRVCPQQTRFPIDDKIPLPQQILGEYDSIWAVKSKDKKILSSGMSGGAITTIVTRMLGNGYGKAFLLDGYAYETQMQTKAFKAGDDLNNTPKSRYLTISHQKCAEYMCQHPDEKIIIVGTGCAINGLVNLMDLKKLHRENYLLLGLFCDKTMHYGVVEYFKQKIKKDYGTGIAKLYFRTKDKSGWPGDVRIELDDGRIVDLPRQARMEVKDFFMPECCLYCLNKLNLRCDIAFGDNYIKEFEDKEGGSSLIVRTKTGRVVFESTKDAFTAIENSEEQLLGSLGLGNRERNLAFARLKGLIDGKPIVKRKYCRRYTQALRKIKIGHKADVYKSVQRDIRKTALLDKLKKWFKLKKK
ncbi:MAG: Coenzyme F420 hydrogenase/dehydrogenase, beta subunit C-terminal domain [Alphaproteobacteria bacterium]|nr:Coenzyme F420 hydrogenase/dehydrogenase, beta subunit C-terminal domain [Alphaproteobacteria bacterium]MBQ9234937.1 Coenzyme F420 hydrogenase/dehydrogenase, beta subunit C-terminal domain [Alphaproteobacteria bacterium]